MGAAGGRDGPGLTAGTVERRLFDEPRRFDVFQAVRLLEAFARQRGRDDAGVPSAPVGCDWGPAEEAVRLRTTPSLRFPAGGVSALEPGRPTQAGRTGQPTLTVAFFGLVGTLGALPPPYSELVLRRLRLRDATLRDFLDLFDHRAVSLFVRAHEKHRPALLHERAAAEGATDAFAGALFALAGFGTGRLRGRLEVADDVFVRFAGHFARRARPVVGLEAVLSEYFGLPVEVRQFSGEWLTLPLPERTVLPSEKEPRGRHTRLGHDVIVGSHAFDVCGRFRVRVGPVGYAHFRRLMPTGDLLGPFCDLVRAWAGSQFDFDVVPVLAPDEAPACVLGAQEPDAPRLGWNTWIRTGAVSRTFDGVGFALDRG